MKKKMSGDDLLNRISEPGREFVRLISSSSLEEIQYNRDDILRLIEQNEELKKETETILSVLVDFGVIPKIEIENERK